MLIRRRMMVESGASTPKYTIKSMTGNGNRSMNIGLDYSPALVCAWSTYRFINSGYAASGNGVFVTVVNGKSLSAKSNTTSNASASWGNGSLSSAGALIIGPDSTYKFVSGQTYVIAALDADALANGVPNHVFVTSFVGDGTKNHTVNCPFAPDVAICYNATGFSNQALSSTYTNALRVYDVLNTGYINAHSNGGTSLGYISMGASTSTHTGEIVYGSQYFKSDTYVYVGIKL